MLIKILLLVLFFASMITVGVMCKKHSKDSDGFVLGGRNVGPWLTAFAYGTSYFSAVIFIGYAGQFGFKYGISATWIGIGNAIIGSLLAWVILGRRTRLMTQHLDSSTMPEFFGKRFNSRALKIAASIIVFVFLIPYTASLYNGLSRLFEMAFDIPYTVCIVAMAVITAVYVIIGGYMATAVNDFIQGLIMLVGIVAVVLAVLNLNGGFMGSLDALSKVNDAAVSSSPGVFASMFGPKPLELLFVVILTSLGTWGLPQMVQKFYSIKNEKQIHKGTVISTLFAFVVAGGCYFLGGFGRLFVTEIGAGGYDAIIPTMLERLPDLLIAVVVILVLSASMSTLSSLVLTSSTTLTYDLIKETIYKKMDDKKKLIIVRCFVLVFIAISSVIAIIQYESSVTFIAQLMGISWGALAGAFLGPFLCGLYFKKTSKFAVWVSFIFGSGLMIVNMLFREIFPPFFQSPINCGVIAMLFGLVMVPLISLFTQPKNKEEIDAMFSCYEDTVEVSKKEGLGD